MPGPRPAGSARFGRNSAQSQEFFDPPGKARPDQHTPVCTPAPRAGGGSGIALAQSGTIVIMINESSASDFSPAASQRGTIMPLSAFATIVLKPSHFAQARAAVVGIVARTRAEAGCMAFELHEAPDEATLHLYEVWADSAAFEAHHAEDYTREIFRKYEQWLAKPVEITFMQPVECSS